jgi:triosephosphate isomerase
MRENSMQPLIAGNWKMNGLGAQLPVIEAVAARVLAEAPAVDVLLCVPATLLWRAAESAAGRIVIGAEDCSADIAGAHTGDISVAMLKDAGAAVVIVGHSERRQHHGETDALVASKAKAAWRGGLKSIICIGETASQRKDGAALSVCAAQIEGSVPVDMPLTGNEVAYEPLWAIGTGDVPTPQQIEEMHRHIRACLLARLGAHATSVRILYGGSVKPANAREILALDEVGGALVGGASLAAADFNGIIREARH